MKIAVVNAFKTYTGSTLAAKAYYGAFKSLGAEPRWYQCVSSRSAQDWDRWGSVIPGVAVFNDEANLVLNSLFVFPRRLATLREDLVFLTDPILLRAARHLPRSVLLVHDLREFDPYRRGYASTFVYRRLFQDINRVQRIICVSRATKDRLMTIMSPRVPVDVLYHCPPVRGDPNTHLTASLARLDEDRALNVLYLAADRPYKNIDLFCKLASYFSVHSAGISLRFHLVSKLRPTTRRKVSRLALGNLVVSPEVPDLTALYSGTDILVHPSLEEGMGLPLAEAMQFGIPIVASDIPAVREVVSEGGTLVPPGDFDGWVEGLLKLTSRDRFTEAAGRSAQRGIAFSAAAFEGRVKAAFPELEAQENGLRRTAQLSAPVLN
jgi:glycosyltransferase involved in cell wall biosynthesis